MCLFYRVAAEVKPFSGVRLVSAPDSRLANLEVSDGTLTNLLHDGDESLRNTGIGTTLGTTKSDSPRLGLADATGSAILLGGEGPAHGDLTGGRILSGAHQPDRVALLITGELGDDVTGDGEIRHVFFPC